MPLTNVKNARFKVPKIKVSTTTVHIGRRHTKHFKLSLQPASSSVAKNEEIKCNNELSSAEEIVGPLRSYSERKKRAVDQWTEIRTMLAHARIVYQSHHIVDNRMCADCVLQPGCMRCYDCGPTYWACETCCLRRHKVSPLHVMEIWKGEVFMEHEGNRDAILNSSNHEYSCATRDCKCITVYDVQGRRHYMKVFGCKCTPFAVTLVRCGIWPAVPENPSVAFSWELLEMLRALMLECQISAQGFCRALRCKSSLSDSECNTLYRFLINESFEEFRHAFYRLQSFRDVCPQSDDGTLCPCCNKNPSNCDDLYVTLFDGNAGLVRKVNSGKSYEPPKHGSLLFDDDDVTEDFVTSYSDKKSDSHDVCNDFKAGNKLRSVVATKKLAVTGIFGSSCKHEIPTRFVNMKHGERLGYPVYVLNSLVKKLPDELTIGVLYDISCVLHRNMMNNMLTGSTPLNRFRFAIPAFHAYGHRVPCQVKYGVTRANGFGLCDGEGMERLWSYLRPFSRITKEMTPSHRIDLLTDALLHYSERKKNSLGRFLVGKMRTAGETFSYCETELQKIYTGYGVSGSVVSSWCEVEESEICDTMHLPKSNSSEPWQESYVTMLMQLEASRSALESAQLTNDVDMFSKAKHAQLKIQKKVAKIERKHAMVRWSIGSDDFKLHQRVIVSKQQENLCKDLHQLAQERLYLLELKKKYAVGQKVFIRLNRQLQNVNKKIRSSLQAYNNTLSVVPSSTKEITFDEVLDMNGVFYNRWVFTNSASLSSSTPPAVKRQAVNLHQKCQRAKEEQLIVRQEMKRYSNYLANEHTVFYSALTDSDECSPQYKLSRAGSGLICKKLIQLETKYHEASSLFNPYLDNMPPLYLSMTSLIDKFEDSALLEQSMESTISDVEDDASDSEEYEEDLHL